MRKHIIGSLWLWFMAFGICVLFTSPGFASVQLSDDMMKKISGGCTDTCYITRACSDKSCVYPSGIDHCMTCYNTGGQLDKRCWETQDGSSCDDRRDNYGCGFTRRIYKKCPASEVCSWSDGDRIEDTEDYCPQYVVLGNSKNCPGELP